MPRSRRHAIAVGLLVGAAMTASQCRGVAPAGTRTTPRVFVIGFDGMDPTLARRWMDDGRLPQLKRLADEGTFATLGTSQPSESPTAWSSFATGVNPGRHNIYDFLVRDPATYAPDLGMVRREPPHFLWNWIPTRAPRVVSIRGGTSFWLHADRAGLRTRVITVPTTFPPEPLEHGQMLSGLPLPDLRGTPGAYSFFGTDVSRFEEGPSEFGGWVTRLAFEGDTARTRLAGPPNPIVRRQIAALSDQPQSDSRRTRLAELEAREFVDMPLTLRWARESRRLTVAIDGQSVTLAEGEWSAWVPLTFRMNVFLRVRGMVQFHVVKADTELRLYVSPINVDPRDPVLPMSSPARLASDVAGRIGPYRTLGWAESADKALNDGRLDEAAFLADAWRAMDDRERLILDSLASDDWDLFVAAIETTDRVSHMMWRLIDPAHPMYDADLAARYGDAIERVYRRADDFVGRLRARLPADTVFMVMSDHGFHSFRRGVNLNTWLVEQGYMSFTGQEGEKKSLSDLFGRGRYFEGVDWSRTKAYAVGLGQIYFNLRGREGQGIVSSGAEYSALQREMRAKLLALTDAETGRPVFGDIYLRDEIYSGEYIAHAPDLQVGFLDGYRVGWQDTLGGIARDVIEDNRQKWSGDHCATMTDISGGVLFVNRPLTRRTPHIMDLAPTILAALGVPVPAGLDGTVFSVR